MLTTTQIRALKPEERPYKVADGDGLYLLVPARTSEFLFPARHITQRPICENTFNVALRQLGYPLEQGVRLVGVTVNFEPANSGMPLFSDELPLA